MNQAPSSTSTPRKESLIEYPCVFPIKVMGMNTEALLPAVTALAQRFDPGFDAACITLKESRAGNYLGVTITIVATSRQQLDGLYQALVAHPLVKMVL